MNREDLQDSLVRVERLVVVLRYWDELSFTEIADVLGLPLADVVEIHQRICERAQRRPTAK